ncbi:MAG: BphX family protein [Burkholderiaceae bacterium]|jgi:hypothetical protein
MKQGRIFLWALGLFYLANLVGTLPFASASLFAQMYPGFAPDAATPAFQLLSDAWAVVGLQLGAIGIVALWGARDPLRYLAVFDIVIATELVDGLWDFYSITWSHLATAFGLTTLVIHPLWIVWALYARRAVVKAAR